MKKKIAKFNYKLEEMEQRCQLALWTLSGCWRYFKHLLYKCTLTFMVENILRKISLLVGLEITWKILTLGFYIEINTKTTWLNNLLRCFTIYKYKIEIRFKRRILSMSIMNLKIKVKKLPLFTTSDSEKSLS